MNEIQLFKTITGIGAASGLLYVSNFLYLISDNSTFLYQYKIDTEKLSKIELTENSQENIPKKQKLDLEAITLKKNKLHIFGSGSKDLREIKFSFDLKDNTVKTKILSKLYKKLKETKNFKNDDLNIEGAFYHNKKQYLFQRGNGKDNLNGVFIVDANKKSTFFKVTLPAIKSINATFTDAILVVDKIYFLAAVENTDSTFDDGEILGSFLGCMSLNFEIDFVNQIADKQKFEGLTLYQKNETEISFLLCEDNDSDLLISNIYKIVLNANDKK